MDKSWSESFTLCHTVTPETHFAEFLQLPPLHVQLRGICTAISAAHRGVFEGCATETKSHSPPNPIKFAYSPLIIFPLLQEYEELN